MALPYGTTGSLCSAFAPDRLVGLSVKRPLPLHSTAGYQRPEGTFKKPPLRFWRRPPQSNYPPNAVLPSRELGTRQPKGRISTATPRTLACPLLSLRPILHIDCPVTTLSYSKGSRGLFVPSRVIGIFTDTTISLESWLRQCPGSLHHSCRSELTRQGISLP